MKVKIARVFFSRILASLFQGMTVVFLARVAPIGQFGSIFGTLAISTIVMAFFEFGFSNALPVWFQSGKFESVKNALSLSGFVNVLVAIAISFSTAIHLSFGHEILSLSLVIFAYAAERQSETLTALAVAQDRILRIEVSIVGRRIICLIGLFTLVFFHIEPGFAFGISFLAGSLFALIVIWPSVHNKATLSWANILALFFESRHFYIANLAGQLRELDVFSLSIFRGAKVTGLYSSAQKVTSPLSLLATTLSQFYLTLSANRSYLWLRYQSRTLTVASVLAVLILLITWPFSSSLFLFLFTSSYKGALGPLFWGLLGVPIQISTGPISSMLMATKDEKHVGRLAILLGIMTVIVTIPLALLGSISNLAFALFLMSLLRLSLLIMRVERNFKRQGQ